MPHHSSAQKRVTEQNSLRTTGVDRDESIVVALSKVEACVVEMADWTERNKLKLNKEKSEAIIFITAKQ